MSVEILPSARDRSARENLSEYVRYARHDIAAFGSGMPFDDAMWNVTESHVTRASSGHQTARLYFTTHEGGTSKSLEGRIALAEPFASFLKAVVRRRQDGAPVAHTIHQTTIRAGRYLYDALAAQGYDPCLLVADHFTQAAEICRRRETAASRYRVGMNLAYLAENIDRYGLARARMDWSNPFSRPSVETRIGKDADKRRLTKLPSEGVLDALAELAGLVTGDADVLRMRVVELLACGGWRINELLTVRADCEVTDTGSGPDGKPFERYGISYYAEKMGGPTIKWIPTSMVDVARRAIRDIRRVTLAARGVAAWMAANEGRAWLPERARAQHSFDATELAAVLGLSGPGAARQFMAAADLGIRDGGAFPASDVEAAILGRRPKFAGQRLPWPFHELLFVMPENWSHATRGTMLPIVNIVRDQNISDLITGREGIPSIFERFGYREPDGSPIAVTSHQFRHWLNTLAQRGGMGQMEIARWSGRKDVSQNAAYDHVTGTELAERVRRRMDDGQVHGPIARTAAAMDPVRREEFIASRLTTAHVTDLGMCVNDWAMTPCASHGACAVCGEHMVVKGRPEQRQRAVQMKTETEALLAVAREELSDGTYGASNFVAHHGRVVDALARIIAVHDDGSIPADDLVQVTFAKAPAWRLPTGGRRAP